GGGKKKSAREKVEECNSCPPPPVAVHCRLPVASALSRARVIMAKVLIAPAPLAKLEAGFLDELRAAKLDIAYPARQAQLTEDELLGELKGVSAVVAGSEPYTSRVMDAHPNLRVIARAGVGYDAVDVAAATERGIVVAFTPGTNQDAVAEHT